MKLTPSKRKKHLPPLTPPPTLTFRSPNPRMSVPAFKIGVRACSYCGQCWGLSKLETPNRPWRCPNHKGAHGIPKDETGRVLSAEQLAERARRINELERTHAPRHLRVSKDYNPLEEDVFSRMAREMVIETSCERERVEARRRSNIWREACDNGTTHKVLQRYILNMNWIDLAWRFEESRKAEAMAVLQARAAIAASIDASESSIRRAEAAKQFSSDYMTFLDEERGW